MLLECWQYRFCIPLLLEGRKWFLGYSKVQPGMDLKEAHYKSLFLMDWQKNFQFSPTLTSLNGWQQWKLQREWERAIAALFVHDEFGCSPASALEITADVTWSSDGLQTFPMHNFIVCVKPSNTSFTGEVWKGRTLVENLNVFSVLVSSSLFHLTKQYL